MLKQFDLLKTEKLTFSHIFLKKVYDKRTTELFCDKMYVRKMTFSYYTMSNCFFFPFFSFSRYINF